MYKPGRPFFFFFFYTPSGAIIQGGPTTYNNDWFRDDHCKLKLLLPETITLETN